MLPCELPLGTAAKGQKAMAVVNSRQKTAILSCWIGSAQHLHHSAAIFISSGLSLDDLGDKRGKKKVRLKPVEWLQISSFLQIKQETNTHADFWVYCGKLYWVYGKSWNITSTSQRLRTCPISGFSPKLPTWKMTLFMWMKQRIISDKHIILSKIYVWWANLCNWTRQQRH